MARDGPGFAHVEYTANGLHGGNLVVVFVNEVDCLAVVEEIG